MRSCNPLRNKANASETRLAVSTPSVGTILISDRDAHCARQKAKERACPQNGHYIAAPVYETNPQVARRLNVRVRTVDNLMKKRRLPFIKLMSKIVRFPKADVDAFLARNFRVRSLTQDAGDTD